MVSIYAPCLSPLTLLNSCPLPSSATLGLEDSPSWAMAWSGLESGSVGNATRTHAHAYARVCAHTCTRATPRGIPDLALPPQPPADRAGIHPSPSLTSRRQLPPSAQRSRGHGKGSIPLLVQTEGWTELCSFWTLKIAPFYLASLLFIKEISINTQLV